MAAIITYSFLSKVFIHDPLYKWALTPLGAQKRQKDELTGDSDTAEGGAPQATSLGMPAGTAGSADSLLANADAERALLRLKQKLAGLEGGVHQQNYLILRKWLLMHAIYSAVHSADWNLNDMSDIFQRLFVHGMMFLGLFAVFRRMHVRS